MSDLIRRSDAIDIIEITPFEDYGDYIKAREIIEGLPTIEAVPKDFHDKTCEAMAKRHTEEIQKFMWIPCSERLPREYSDGERVLATTDVDGLGVIIMPIYDVKSWYRKGYISAWMPLPKPYEEREDE